MIKALPAGLKPSATLSDVLAAHRNLMKRLHLVRAEQHISPSR
jgi:hypothetical protein